MRKQFPDLVQRDNLLAATSVAVASDGNRAVLDCTTLVLEAALTVKVPTGQFHRIFGVVEADRAFSALVVGLLLTMLGAGVKKLPS